MRKITILLIASMVIGIGFLSGCTQEQNQEEDNHNFEPIADSLASTESGVYPLTVQFTGSGTDNDGTIVSYYWEFGDGETSNAQNPSHTFQASGKYITTLTVKDDDGATDFDTVTIDVMLTYSPTASASADKTSGDIPLTVQFTGSGTDSDGTISSYHWDFDDGYVSFEQNPKHSFSKEGKYIVELKVTDDMESTDSDTISITVTESKDNYKSTCRDDITYQQLDSNAYAYLDERVTYNGEVVQVLGYQTFRIDVGSNDILYVTTDKSVNLVEDDPVQIWGEVLGYKTYESTAGYSITIPHINAVYLEKASFSYNLDETAEWKGIEITVESAKKTYSYTWTGYSGTKYTTEADGNMCFVIIEIMAKQIGTGSEYISGNDFWLVDTEGNKYDYDSGTFSMDGGLDSTTIYQNQKVEGKVLFQIPFEIQLSELVVQYNFGTSYSPILAEWKL